MNTQNYAKYIGFAVLALGILGLVSGETRLGEVMNVDIGLDLTRIILGAVLVIAGYSSVNAARNGLIFFGLAYLGAFAGGLISTDMFGTLPHGIGIIDQVLHLGGGILALGLAMKLPSTINAKSA